MNDDVKVLFRAAQQFKMPFGKYKGEALDVIASSDNGLKYLAWLHDARREERKADEVDVMLGAYLSDPSIKKELEAL